MSSESVRSLLDALHAELLIDVQTLSGEVEKLRGEVPTLLADISTAVGAANASTRANLADFEAMGHALVGVVSRQVEAERAASRAANAEAAKATKWALERFDKYFWLLSGLTAANFVLLAAILVLKKA